MAKQYRPEELAFIYLYYGELTLSEIGGIVGRSVESVQQIGTAMKITREGWTEEEKKYLIENYATEDMVVMMKKLNRPYKAITYFANRMKLKRNNIINNYRVGNSYNGIKRFDRVLSRKPIKVIHVSTAAEKKPVKEDKVLQLKPFSAVNKKAVRINRKMFVYVPADASPETIDTIIRKFSK